MPECKTPKYEGVLAEPMKLLPEGGINEFGQRLVALKEHYGVEKLDEVGLMELVLSLARDHVPGFQFEDTNQSPLSPKAERNFVLVSEMCAMIEGGHSIRNAARIVVDRHPRWKLRADTARVKFTEIEQASLIRGRRARSEVMEVLRIFLNRYDRRKL